MKRLQMMKLVQKTGVLVLAVLALTAFAFNTQFYSGLGRKTVAVKGVTMAADTKGKAVAAGAKQPLLSLKTINNKFKKYGKMTVSGMKGASFDKAMAAEWVACNQTGTPENLTIELRDIMDYNYVEKTLFNLDKFEGVNLYDIGNSAQNRNIYMLEIDFQNKDHPNNEKPVVLITGNVHAMEFAGCDYALKFANDTVVKAQTDAYTRLLLENVKFEIVPLVNPDGRELEIKGKSRKSNANGIDLNRNMPAINAGQLGKGIKMNSEIQTKAGTGYFPGKNLGSERESQAMIKFFMTWVKDPHTILYADLHQSGQFEYCSKPFLSAVSDQRAKQYALLNNKLLNNGYPIRGESKNYGLDGSGGTMTDFARSVAEGMVFSYQYGRMVMRVNGVETPLISFKDVDKVIKYYRPSNANFVAISPEIGPSGSSGATIKDRNNRYKVYNNYNWASFLTGTAENILGPDKVNALKQEAS